MYLSFKIRESIKDFVTNKSISRFRGSLLLAYDEKKAPIYKEPLKTIMPVLTGYHPK